MAIIDPGEELLGSKQDRIKRDIIQQIDNSFSNLRGTLENVYSQVWFNEILTPQEVMDAFGHQAARLLQVAQTVRQMIVTVDPSVVPPARPYEIVVHQDGTVTVGNPIQV